MPSAPSLEMLLLWRCEKGKILHLGQDRCRGALSKGTWIPCAQAARKMWCCCTAPADTTAPSLGCDRTLEFLGIGADCLHRHLYSTAFPAQERAFAQLECHIPLKQTPGQEMSEKLWQDSVCGQREGDRVWHVSLPVTSVPCGPSNVSSPIPSPRAAGLGSRVCDRGHGNGPH